MEIVNDPTYGYAPEANDEAVSFLDYLWKQGYVVFGLGGSDSTIWKANVMRARQNHRFRRPGNAGLYEWIITGSFNAGSGSRSCDRLPLYQAQRCHFIIMVGSICRRQDRDRKCSGGSFVL